MITKILVTYELSINDLGEIIETKVLSTNTTTQDVTPKVLLLSNQLKLNDYAIALLGIQKGDLVDIRYDQQGPLIGKASNFNIQSGNKLTSSGTVSFKGSQNEELSKFGKEFTLEKTSEGIYRLLSINNNPFTFKNI